MSLKETKFDIEGNLICPNCGNPTEYIENSGDLLSGEHGYQIEYSEWYCPICDTEIENTDEVMIES